jgi:hypothetical protein
MLFPPLAGTDGVASVCGWFGVLMLEVDVKSWGELFESGGLLLTLAERQNVRYSDKYSNV